MGNELYILSTSIDINALSQIDSCRELGRREHSENYRSVAVLVFLQNAASRYINEPRTPDIRQIFANTQTCNKYLQIRKRPDEGIKTAPYKYFQWTLSLKGNWTASPKAEIFF